MIKIIKPGYRKEVECIKCGALLSYDEKEDVQKEESKISAGDQGFAANAGRYIICPQCKNKIMLSAAEMENAGIAAFNCCCGLTGGTLHTGYLQENCVDCPYLVLFDKKGEREK